MALLTRRRLLGAALGLIASGGATYAYARYVEPGWLDGVRLDLSLPKLPDAFAGFTIAHISDLHFGPFCSPADLAPAIDTVLALNADLIAITGDFVSSLDHGENDMIVESLSRLQAREGVLAVLGNHDWWEGDLAVSAALRRAGVTLLSNQHHVIRRGAQALYIAGIDDVWCAKHDLDAALHGIPADGAAIALVHEPDFADTVANDPRVLLQLSGHTHGGQVRVPFCGGLHFPPFGNKYTMGLYQINDMTLYTNRGLGMINRPLRFACRPEVTLFRLMST
jgi:predicted MPP superfamily phosphohydrolase